MVHLVFGVVMCLLALAGVAGYVFEKKAWNEGRCQACGAPLEFADMDSQGGRLWVCREKGIFTHPHVWITWGFDVEASRV